MTANVLATATYGALRAGASSTLNLSGSSKYAAAIATSMFQDIIRIDYAPFTGRKGILFLQYSLSGNLSAAGPNHSFALVNIWVGSALEQQYSALHAASTTGSFSVPKTFTFTYGQPFALRFELDADVGTMTPLPAGNGYTIAGGTGSGSASANFMNTLLLSRLTVADESGNPVSGAQYSADSGTRYSASGVLPQMDTLFSNFSPTDAYSTTSTQVSARQFVGADFNPSSSGVLRGIRLPLAQNGQATGPLIVKLIGPSTDPKGTVLESWSLPADSITSTRTIQSLSSKTHPPLSAGNRYWLTLETATPFPGAFLWPRNVTGDLGFSFSFDGGLVWTTSSSDAAPTFEVNADPPSTGGLRFVPLTPCRLVDTRATYAGPRTGAFGPPLMAADATRTIPITQSTTCSVPSKAKAYALNITLDTIEGGTGPVDSVTVWPAGEPRPEFRTLRTSTGGYIANAAIVKAGSGGSVNVHTTNPVHLIVDINGYFTDEPGTGLLYYPVSPCRAVDTRGPVYSTLTPPFGQQRMQARENRSFRLPATPNPGCQIPVAAAYSMQMTLAPGELTNGDPVAFVSAYPTGVPRPDISNMNAIAGYAVANSAIVPANASGSIDVFAYDATNLIIDVNGYFAPDDGTGRGLSYFPVTQCRVMDTEDWSYMGPFGGPAMSAAPDRTVPIPAGRCVGLPSSARAWAVNASVVPSGGMPYLSLWPSGFPWPNISQLNAFQGQILANSGIVPASADGSIDVRVAGGTHVALEIAGYFAR